METLISVVAFGGNLLLNVGPTSWGTIAPIYEERLLSMGQWLRINGDAIYKTKPWRYQIDSKQNKLWLVLVICYKLISLSDTNFAHYFIYKLRKVDLLN